MMQLFCVDSVLGTALLAAAVDDGAFATDPPARRVLLVANTAEVPEIVDAPQDAPGFASLARRFDEVIDWNAVIAPLHPAGWYPSALERPLLGRLLAHRLGLGPGDDVEVVVEAPDRAPGSALAALLPRGPVTVACASLDAWGPPRTSTPAEPAGRITRLLHLPVLHGLRPLLVAEAGATSTGPVPAPCLVAVLAELPAVGVADDAVLVVAGPDTSSAAHAELIRAVAAGGHHDAVLVPHPAAGDHDADALRRLADELDVRLVITDDGLPAEAVLARSRPALVVGAPCAALVLAQEVFELPVAVVGAERALLDPRSPDRLTAAIVHATVPALQEDGTLTRPATPPLPAVVGAVAYSLSPDVLSPLREDAARFVDEHGGAPFVPRERLVSLGLVEPDPPAPVPPVGARAAPSARRPRPRSPLTRVRRAVRRRRTGTR